MSTKRAIIGQKDSINTIIWPKQNGFTGNLMNLSTTRSRHLPFCTQDKTRCIVRPSAMCLPLLGFLPHLLPANHISFQRHSRLMRVTPFVFYNIPGSSLLMQSRSFVFIYIPASVLHFLKLLIFSFPIPTDKLSNGGQWSSWPLSRRLTRPQSLSPDS